MPNPNPMKMFKLNLDEERHKKWVEVAGECIKLIIAVTENPIEALAFMQMMMDALCEMEGIEYGGVVSSPKGIHIDTSQEDKGSN